MSHKTEQQIAAEIEEHWEFWKPIVSNPDGSINVEQLKKELADFSVVLDNVPKVYCHITGGLMSKALYHAPDVIQRADEYYTKLAQEEREEEDSNNLTELAKAHTAWSLATFPYETAATGLKKLESEVEEIWAAISNRSDFGVAEEYADAIMCLFSSAAQLGVTPDMIADAFADKIAVNRESKWVENADGTHSHVKDEQAMIVSSRPNICPKCGQLSGSNPLNCDCLPF